jgi:hypothetical protein
VAPTLGCGVVKDNHLVIYTKKVLIFYLESWSSEIESRKIAYYYKKGFFITIWHHTQYFWAGKEPWMKYKGDNLSMRGIELAKITQIRSWHGLSSKKNHEHRGAVPPALVPPCLRPCFWVIVRVHFAHCAGGSLMHINVQQKGNGFDL